MHLPNTYLKASLDKLGLGSLEVLSSVDVARIVAQRTGFRTSEVRTILESLYRLSDEVVFNGHSLNFTQHSALEPVSYVMKPIKESDGYRFELEPHEYGFVPGHKLRNWLTTRKEKVEVPLDKALMWVPAETLACMVRIVRRKKTLKKPLASNFAEAVQAAYAARKDEVNPHLVKPAGTAGKCSAVVSFE